MRALWCFALLRVRRYRSVQGGIYYHWGAVVVVGTGYRTVVRVGLLLRAGSRLYLREARRFGQRT